MTAARAIVSGVIAALAIAACDVFRTGPVAPVGGAQVVCQGVPLEACRMAAGTVTSAKVVVRVLVRCTQPVCTDAAGEAEVTIQYVDGTSETSGYGWASAPEPAQPQQPQEPPVPEGS
jgi:hypothetical protein